MKFLTEIEVAYSIRRCLVIFPWSDQRVLSLRNCNTSCNKHMMTNEERVSSKVSSGYDL